MNCQRIIIRPAKKEDMENIVELIKELAQFEKMENQVKITPDILIKDALDTDHPAFFCQIAEAPDGQIMGYALYYIAYSTWRGKFIFLEDIYVRPSYRRYSVGTKLFKAVAKIANGMESKRMDFHVLSWNPAKKFYESLGAQSLTDTESWQLYRLEENALKKMFPV